MTTRKSPALPMGLLYLALAIAAHWPLEQAFAAESLNNSVDLAEVHEFSDDPDQVSKTWENGYVFVPGLVIGEFIYGKMGSPPVQSRLDELPNDVRYPLIVFLHDAAGLTGYEYKLQKALEVENFAMVLPDSYARTDRQSDCEWHKHNVMNCAMSPDVYLSRRSELIHAVRAVRRLSWVDQDNVFLLGSGEGGVAVALWGDEVDVSGYVIADWTCTAPAELPWFDGLRTPSNRPALALTTSGNRWADMPGWDGNCADKANADADVEALVIDISVRNVLGLPEGRRALIEFLYDNRRARLN
jgi:dienelactone hydrolase